MLTTTECLAVFPLLVRTGFVPNLEAYACALNPDGTDSPMQPTENDHEPVVLFFFPVSLTLTTLTLVFVTFLFW